MTINRLRLTIEPLCELDGPVQRLRVEVIEDMRRFTHEVLFQPDDFDSMWSIMMREAYREVLRLARESSPAKSFDPFSEQRPLLGQLDRHSASPSPVESQSGVKQSSPDSRELSDDKCHESDYRSNESGQGGSNWTPETTSKTTDCVPDNSRR